MIQQMELLTADLKTNNQDFEFYPTTDEIINRVIIDMNSTSEYSYRAFDSVLDIGAGNGKVLKAIKKAFDIDTYAIEKSERFNSGSEFKLSNHVKGSTKKLRRKKHGNYFVFYK